MFEALEPRRLMAMVEHFGDIATDQTWAGGDVHLLTGNVTVKPGATLTIQPGAVVKSQSFFISLFVEGTLNAQGTAAANGNIVFTSPRDDLAGGDTNGDGAATMPGPSDWGALVITPSGVATIEHAQFRFGAGGMLTSRGGLTLQHSTLRNSGGFAAFRIENSDPTVTSVVFQNNAGAAVSMDLNSNPAIQNASLTNNGVNGLLLDGGALGEDGFWDDSDIPYVMNSNITVPTGRKLTVDAGQVVKNGNFFASLLVDGTLEARGVAGDPVIFTSLEDDTAGGDSNNDANATAPAASDWGVIVLSGPGSVMEQVEVRYGAANQLSIRGGALTLSDGVFRNSGGAAVRIENSDTMLTRVTFANNNGPAVSMDLNSNPTIQDVTLTNNQTNGLLLDGGALGKDLAWDDPDITYVMNSNITVPADRKLTMSAGQVLKNGNFFASLLVNGALEARGEPDAPVVFTSIRDDTLGGDANNDGNATAPAASDWGVIVLSGPGNVMEQIEVRYGAGGMLKVAGGALALSQGLFHNSGGAAVRIENSDPTFANVTFANNAGAAVSMDLNSNPTIRGVTVSGNAINGLALDGGALVKDLTWDDPDIAYVMNSNITVPGDRKLTMGAGQVLKNGNFFASLLVNGALEARGEPDAPVVFTSLRDDTAGGDANNDGATTIPTPSDWGGIVLSGPGNVMDQVEIRYGAGNQLTVDGGALTLTNSLARNAGGAALRIANSDPTLTNLTFTDNLNGPAVSMDLNSNPAIQDVTLTNNQTNGLILDGGSLVKDLAWDDGGIPYVMVANITVPVGRKLTVGAGQVVKNNNFFASLLVDGTLEARGTPGAPVVFTALRDDTAGGDTNNDGDNTTAAPSSWGNIIVRSAGNVMERVEVRYGTGGQVNVDGGELMLASSVVRHSGNMGVLVQNAGMITATNNLIYANAGDGVQVVSDGTANLTNNTIDGNFRGVHVAQASATLVNNLITFHIESGVRSASGTLSPSFNVVHNPTATRGNYDGLPNPTDQNGNLAVDPKYFNRTNRQYQLRAGSRAIDSGTSNGAPSADRLGNPRFDDPNVLNVGAGAQPFVDRGAMERQEVSISNVDLATTAVNGPALGLAEQQVTVNWTVQNLGSETALGSWRDAVYLSPDRIWTPDDVMLGQMARAEDLGPGQTYNGSAQVLLPAVLPGDYFFLVRANSQQDVFEGVALMNNIAASVETVAMDMPVLGFDAPAAGQLDAKGDFTYYRISTPAGADLNLELTGANAVNELYVDFGQLPTRQQFQVRSNQPGAANQTATVSNTREGAYYVLVFGAQMTAAQNFTITASLEGFGIQSVTPAQGSNLGDVTILLRGARFTDQTVVRLVDSGGATLTPKATHFTDSGLISATFDLRGRPLGFADVQVTNPGDVTLTLPDGFTIAAGEPGRLVTTIKAPSGVRLGRDFELLVEYSNVGDTDLPAPIMQLQGQGLSDLGFARDTFEPSGLLTLVGVNPQGPAGVLPPGASGKLTIFGKAQTNGNERFQLAVEERMSGPIDWPSLKPSLRPLGISDADWEALFAEIQSVIGNDWSDYRAAIARAATLLPPNRGLSHRLSDVFQLVIDEAIARQSVSVRGVIHRADTGVPLPNAPIRFATATSDSSYQIVSNQDGSFLLPRAVPGDYEATVEGFYSETPVQVTVGASDLENVEFAVGPGSPLSGKVVRAASGAAVRDALVRAVSEQGRVFSARTDSSGQYEFASLPNGRFDIYVTSELFLPAMLDNMELPENEVRRDVNFALADAAVMRGVIIGPNGPVEGASITAASQGEVFSALSDAMGQYRLLTAPGRQYTVTAKTEVLFASPRINVFASAVNVNFQLTAGGAVTGQTTLPGGAPAALKELRLQGPGGAIVSSTDEQGNYSETGLPPGQYTITVDLGEHMPFTSAPFNVTAGATTNFDFQLAPAGVVSGFVRDQAGGPVRKVVVHALGADGLVAVTVTDDQGQYMLSGFDAGTYTIVVGDEFSPGLSRRTIALDAAQPTHQADFTLNVAGLVSGRVLERDGQTPVANAVVHLVQQGKELLRMETDAAGQYAFVIVEPGVYQLEAEALGSAFSTIKNISVMGGGSTTGQDLIEGNQTISGVVRAAADAAPIAGATVAIHRNDPDLADTEISFVVTKADGTFTFSRATAGDYTLVVQAAGFAAVGQNITAPGGSTGLQFDLAPESVLRGTVRDLATGEVLENAMVSLSSASGGPIRSFAFTDAVGVYRFPGLPPGIYQLIVRAASHETLVAANVNVAGAVTSQNVALRAASTSVSGVAQSGGVSLSDATVYAEDIQGRILASAITDAAGAFTLATLPPGIHQLFALAPGYRPSNAVEITLSEGQDLENVNLALAPAALSDIEVPANPDVVKFHFDIKKPPVELHNLTPAEQAILNGAGECLQVLAFTNQRTDVDEAYSNLSVQHSLLNSLVRNSNLLGDERRKSLNALQNTLRLFDKVAEKLISPAAIDDLLSGLPSDPLGITRGIALELLKSSVSFKDDINKINQLRADLTSAQNSETDFAAGVAAGEALNKTLDKLRDRLAFINAAGRAALGAPPISPAPAFSEIQTLLLDQIAKRAAKSENGQLAIELLGPDFVTNLIDLPLGQLDRFKNQIQVRIELQKQLANYAENLRAYRQQVKFLKDSLNGLKNCGCKPSTPTPPNPGSGEGELSTSFSSCTIAPPPQQQLVVAAQATTRFATSFDPNDKIGPSGFGTDGFTQPGVMPFTILFENDPALGATIPAQEVFVTDVLDADLDLTTIEFTRFGFNNFEFDVPLGLSRYETVIDLRPEGINLLVPVLLEVDPETRELKATFRSLDPLTGLLPDELDAGFLPVNDKMLHNGEGFFSYRVQPLADRSTGSVILNQASIVFDVNAPILTPQTRHTLDEAAPSSQVNALPAVMGTANFMVAWSGLDDAGGSGVATFDVFVSVNGAPFSVWLENTTHTSAAYPGAANQSYRFYTVARDNVGWQEAPPATFDAETRVTLAAWQNPANRFDVTANGSVGLEDLLAIVSDLRNFGIPHVLPPQPTAELPAPPFVDVENNGLTDLADLLAVVRTLRAQIDDSSGEAELASEGEAAATETHFNTWRASMAWATSARPHPFPLPCQVDPRVSAYPIPPHALATANTMRDAAFFASAGISEGEDSPEGLDVGDNVFESADFVASLLPTLRPR